MVGSYHYPLYWCLNQKVVEEERQGECPPKMLELELKDLEELELVEVCPEAQGSEYHYDAVHHDV